jgi:hypothetical protein
MTDRGWAVRVLAIKAQVDPEEVLALLGITMERGGQLSCPNPTHRDQHPSARFYVDGGKVHCFTCAQTWDMVGLVQLTQGVSFPEAVVWLEEAFMVAAADDASAMVEVLRRRGAPDCSGLVALVSATVRTSRSRCTLAQYAKLWRAFDVACHHFAERKIDEATFVAALDRVLALTPPADAPERAS